MSHLKLALTVNQVSIINVCKFRNKNAVEKNSVHKTLKFTSNYFLTQIPLTRWYSKRSLA